MESADVGPRLLQKSKASSRGGRDLRFLMQTLGLENFFAQLGDLRFLMLALGLKNVSTPPMSDANPN